MKHTTKIQFAWLLMLGMVPGLLSAQGIEFFHGTWQEALAKAKAEDKLIFVDAYAEWCGPCKKMAAETFPDPKVGEFFNPNFVCLKIDMEKEENAEFAGKFPVSAYPTLMFVDNEGKLAAKQTGALRADGLVDFAKKALGKSDKSAEMATKYEEGERDPEFVLNYVRALNRSGKPSLKITNEYLNTQKDLTTPFNLRFILEGASEADSRVFDLLIKNRAAIEQLESRDAVNTKIEKACQNTARKAIEFKDKKILEEAKTKMKANNPAKYPQFEIMANSKYAIATKDAGGYLKVMKAKQKEVGTSAARLQDLVVEMIRAFPEDKKVLGQAQKWAAMAAEKGGLPDQYLTLATVYKLQGNKAKARKAAEDAQKAIGEKDTQNMGQKISFFLNDL